MIALGGCSSRPVRETTPAPEAPLPSTGTAETSELHLDLDALEQSLGLSGQVTDLGYHEKSFNTCTAGYGYSSSHDCRKQVMTVIRFRLSCRESEGTESDVDYQQSPVYSNSLRWSLGNQKGNVATNTEGYGSIRALYPISNRGARLKITLGNNFLVVRAEDIRRIVAPNSFCSTR